MLSDITERRVCAIGIKMRYDFDEIIERKNTDSEKFDFAAEFGKGKDLLPMWVADMDFGVLPQIKEAIFERAKHPIYGYSEAGEDYYKAVQGWFKDRFDFETKRQWIVKTPGIVNALCIAIRAFTSEGEGIIIQPPVYYPFARSIILNGRKLVNNPLIYRDGAYGIDFEDFEKKIVEGGVRMFIFCSPHNPVGRVWTKEELKRLGDICLKHKVIVFSDEIHCDFVRKGHKHTVLSSINPKYLKNVITATAPSKTFNLAGLKTSNIFIADENMRAAYARQLQACGSNMINAFGLRACKAAYLNGAGWVDQMNDYIDGNFDFVRDAVRDMRGIKFIEAQGTYLAWLDMNGLKLSRRALRDLVENKAKLWIDEGEIFGQEGKGFIRINIACPLSTVKKACLRLNRVLG